MGQWTTVVAAGMAGSILWGCRMAVPEAIQPPATAWQSQLAQARTSAESGTVRAEALEILNTADGNTTLVHAISLLGFVGKDDDVPLLESFVRTGDPSLVAPALEAIGRIGSPSAVQTLLTFLDERRVPRNSTIHALGLAGDPTARRRLIALLPGPDTAAAEGLAIDASPDAVAALVSALEVTPWSRASPIAVALAFLAPTVPEAALPLEQILAGPHTPRRQVVVQALSAARDPIVLDVLLQDLQSTNPRRASAAASSLGALGDPRPIPALARIAEEGHPEVRGSAMGALGALDHPDADRALLALVETARHGVAVQAVFTLPRVDSPEVRARLLAVAETCATDVRYAIESRLLDAPWPPGQVPAEVLALARNALTRRSSSHFGLDPVSLLIEHGGPGDHALLLASIEEMGTQQRASMAWALQMAGGPIAQQLIVRLADDPESTVRQAAWHAMIELGMEAEVEERALAQLASGHSDQGNSEYLLVRLGSAPGLDRLFARVEEGTRQESNLAVSALTSGAGPEVAARLLKIADGSDDPDLKNNILSSILYSDAMDLEPVLQRALDAGIPALESTATMILAQQGTAEARDTLTELATSASAETRGAALSALSQMGGEDVEAILIDALEDEEVSWAAISGLQQMGSKGARKAILDASQNAEDPQIRASLVGQIGWQGTPDSLTIVRGAIHDDDPMVRQAAVSALEGMGSTAAAQTLADWLTDADIDDDDRVWAAMSLQRIGGEVARRHEGQIQDLVPQPVDTGR